MHLVFTAQAPACCSLPGTSLRLPLSSYLERSPKECASSLPVVLSGSNGRQQVQRLPVVRVPPQKLLQQALRLQRAAASGCQEAIVMLQLPCVASHCQTAAPSNSYLLSQPPTLGWPLLAAVWKAAT